MLSTIAAFDRIGEENAFAVLQRATALARAGRDIVNLGIGQPDFATPDNVVEAAVKALRDGHHGYTPATGILPLREAVAADLYRRFGVAVSLSWTDMDATCHVSPRLVTALSGGCLMCPPSSECG